MIKSPWLPDEDATLTAMWKDGKSCSDIAKKLGRTRNSVVGRVHRLQNDGKDLKKRPSPIKVKHDTPHRNQPMRFVEEPKRRGNQCWEEGCCEQIERGSYCSHHAELYYVKPNERKRILRDDFRRVFR